MSKYTWVTLSASDADLTDSNGLTLVTYLAPEATERTFDYSSLITDRTLSDVERVKTLAAIGYGAMTAAERAEWATNLKGAYNASDMTRVSAAAKELVDRLAYAGYDPAYEPDGAWEEGADVLAGELERYLANVAGIDEAMGLDAGLPTTMSGLNHLGANAIEAVLRDADETLLRMERSWIYSNELESGEF